MNRFPLCAVLALLSCATVQPTGAKVEISGDVVSIEVSARIQDGGTVHLGGSWEHGKTETAGAVLPVPPEGDALDGGTDGGESLSALRF